jgi:membrane protease YdiL (CAAX protease family)
VAWFWLLFANVALFGLVRYTARSREAKQTKGVNWDGYDAVLVTVAIYLLSQLIAGISFGLVIAVQGGSNGLSEQLGSSITTQFFYILLVEALTLGSLHYLLKLRGNGLKMLGLTKPDWNDLSYTLLGLAMYLPLLLVTLQLVNVFLPQVNLDQQQDIGFSDVSGALQLGLVFVSLVILPPVTEEILARGFLYLGLKKHLKKIYAVLITSLLFAIAHLQFGSGNPPLWTAAIDTFLLSLVLIYIRDKTGKLWAPIGLHVLKNYIAFMALFVFKL